MASLSQGRTAAAQCSLFTHKSVPVTFEPPCSTDYSSVTIATCHKWAPVTKTWPVIRFRMEEAASLYKVLLRIYWINQIERPKRSGPPACVLGEGLTLLTVYTYSIANFP